MIGNRQDSVTNLSPTARVGRAVIGSALIIAPLLDSGPLGWTATLPLVATYPVITAIIGWDPFYGLAAAYRKQKKNPTQASGATQFSPRPNTAASGRTDFQPPRDRAA